MKIQRANSPPGYKPRYLTALFLALIVLPFHIHQGSAQARPIYIVSSWQDYLRLVPLSVRDGYVPLLYNEKNKPTAAILTFAGLYGGHPITLDTKEIEPLIAGQWPRAEKIVVTQNHRRLALVASTIAAALKAPLYFSPLPPEALQQSHTAQVLAVGDVVIPDTPEVVRLRDLEEALAYYDTLVGHKQIAVLAADDHTAFLAAQVAAYHRSVLILEASEIPQRRPRYLAWVVRPGTVTPKAVQDLYTLCRFTPGSRVYDVGFGVLTGLNLHDTALLIARAYAYPDLQGPWKTRLVDARADRRAGSQTPGDGPFEVVTLQGDDLTDQNLLQAMESAAQVMVEAHGDPSGFKLSNGRWRGPDDTAGLPPFVFVAESCATADIAGHRVKNSVALHIVAGGAVAYIGSMGIGGVGLIGDYPFAFSTPRVPLGELVRLQNAARMDLDADVPRVLLIGEPTFHQSAQEWIHYDILPAKNSTGIEVLVKGQRFPTAAAFELPYHVDVTYAQAILDEDRRVSYTPGSLYFDRPLATAPASNRQTVLLEWPGRDGKLLLHQRQPLAATVRHLVSDSLAGLEAIFIDLLTIQQGLDWAIIVASLVSLLIIRHKRPSMRVQECWTGLLSGAGMGLLATIYCLALDFPPLCPGTASVCCGATAAVWIVFPTCQGPRRVLLTSTLFVAPLLSVGLVAVLIGVSTQTQILIAWGLLAAGSAHSLVTAVANWTTRVIFCLSNQRRVQ